jgi:cobalt-zinc-cadmium efflux system protein
MQALHQHNHGTGHNHAHDHSHSHHHVVRAEQVNTAFIVGISLNFVFVLIEAFTGLQVHSLSLLSDAGHNLADVASLALSLFAFRMLKVKATEKYTYGYRKTTILAALLNAVVLVISIALICYEALLRLFNPEPMPGKTIAIVSFIGILINSGTALLFFREKDKDLNVKSAYLHLVADALVSLALVIGGIIIYFTHWYQVDSLLSIGVAIFILVNTWKLLTYSLRLSLDGVPEGIDLDSIKTLAESIRGIQGIKHIHVWAISTSQNALTAQVELQGSVTADEEKLIKKELRHGLLHLNIQHSTLETERPDQTLSSVTGHDATCEDP